MGCTAKRLKYLEGLMPKEVPKIESREKVVCSVEEKYRAGFEKYAQYMGNGIYSWRGMYSTDTAELFMIVVLNSEGIKFKEQ